METTTIEITTDQKAQLDELRATGQAYKHIIADLIADYSQENKGAIDDYSLEYDDVKAACKAALNDELPEHAFR